MSPTIKMGHANSDSLKYLLNKYILKYNNKNI